MSAAATGAAAGGWAGPIGMAGGALVGGLIGMAGQSSANEANRAEALRARRYNTSFDGTRYQRMMADMSKAGLNPMLAMGASPGGGSSSAQAVAQNEASSMAAAVQEGISTAMERKRLDAEIQSIEAARDKMYQETWKASQEAQAAAYEQKIMQENFPTIAAAAKLNADTAKKQAQYDNKMAGTDAALKRIGAAVNIGSSAVGVGRMIKGMGKKETTTETFNSGGEHIRTTIRK